MVKIFASLNSGPIVKTFQSMAINGYKPLRKSAKTIAVNKNEPMAARAGVPNARTRIEKLNTLFDIFLNILQIDGHSIRPSTAIDF